MRTACAFCGSADVRERLYSAPQQISQYLEPIFVAGMKETVCPSCNASYIDEEQSNHNFDLFRSRRDSVTLMTAEMIAELRRSFDLTEKEFGTLIGVPSMTVKLWERGGLMPHGANAGLMRLVYDNPNLVKDLARLTGVDLPNLDQEKL